MSIFLCYLTSGSSSAVCSFNRLCVIFVAVFRWCFKPCAALALAAAASAAGSLMSNPSQLGNSGWLVCVCLRVCSCIIVFSCTCDRQVDNMSREGVPHLHSMLFFCCCVTHKKHTHSPNTPMMSVWPRLLDVFDKVKSSEPLTAVCLHGRFPFYQSHSRLFDLIGFFFFQSGHQGFPAVPSIWGFKPCLSEDITEQMIDFHLL